ncbi:hypothetical protein AKJ56_00740 [candidate division MSBL1 archaeon SCGC-AAA382N08]|uniref:Uncharacterized protein n=1 Tax=candidate division MSBL1 archaeon SCGC-AAA382N08 TaxID=1698285 RepID=A0A133VQD3_9EURY|nr:hypothetical protein AKJ56_00740 [candidate division MSBL1 archaeon SCGC-AAA382N08]
MEDSPIKITKATEGNKRKPVIVVSSKVSKKAVERNTIKRRVREIIKDKTSRLRGCKIIVSPAVLNLSYNQLEQEIKKEINNLPPN